MNFTSSIGFTVVKKTAVFFFEAFSFWNWSISYYGIQLVRVPDVVDVLGESFR